MGRVGAVVVVLRWSRRGEGRSGDVEVASALVRLVDLQQGEGSGGDVEWQRL